MFRQQFIDYLRITKGPWKTKAPPRQPRLLLLNLENPRNQRQKSQIDFALTFCKESHVAMEIPKTAPKGLKVTHLSVVRGRAIHTEKRIVQAGMFTLPGMTTWQHRDSAELN